MGHATTVTAGSRISGTGHYVPSHVMTNRDLESRVDTTDQWIVERTGIRERRIAAEGEATSDMAAEAARRALASAELDARDIDMIIVATVTPDMPLPSTAVFVQAKIGARNDCAAFDIAAACAGFCYALSIADKFVRAGAAKHVMVVGVELLSRVVDWSDRSTCVLFGDGAGAVVVSESRGDGRGILSTAIHADGSYASALRIPGGGSAEPASARTLELKRHFVEMNGREIFKVAVKNLSSASAAALTAAGVAADDLDWVVPHQANLRILEGVAERTGVPLTRFYLNLARYGNTSSASIPIALDEAVREGAIKAGQSVLFCALGGGVAWGSAVIRW
ncbi:beta-ketoacyl-ACP synthase III [Sandaracinus amylolyticus]|uniref:beta-ketoacyl-ACP synthase III n=1 Tax=Sandaracinus amylolyticus TaxID=927083 RepID=UPI00069ED5A3|nr:beta-ketoacyl-ACP synthase III [Sandaracinus amylolyticus]